MKSDKYPKDAINDMSQNNLESYPSQYYQQAYQKDDEIDLKELFLALWKGKWIIILTTFLFSAGGVFYALSLPNIYKASVVVTATQADGRSGLASMAAQFGGLASLAGINLNSGSSNNSALALATLQSRQFINFFIHKHDLLVPLMAAKKWDASSNQVILDKKLYNSEKNEWVREVKAGGSLIPTDWEAYKVFKNKVLSINEAKDTGLVTISVNYYSPEVAQKWGTWLVEDLNHWMKEKSLNKTKRNIDYLKQQLEKTRIADMQSVFYQLIEEQTKNLMLAEVEDEFSFKVIDPAVVPEERDKPKRTLICILAALLGGMLGSIIVLVGFTFRKNGHKKMT